MEEQLQEARGELQNAAAALQQEMLMLGRRLSAQQDVEEEQKDDLQEVSGLLRQSLEGQQELQAEVRRLRESGTAAAARVVQLEVEAAEAGQALKARQDALQAQAGAQEERLGHFFDAALERGLPACRQQIETLRGEFEGLAKRLDEEREQHRQLVATSEASLGELTASLQGLSVNSVSLDEHTAAAAAQQAEQQAQQKAQQEAQHRKVEQACAALQGLFETELECMRKQLEKLETQQTAASTLEDLRGHLKVVSAGQEVATAELQQLNSVVESLQRDSATAASVEDLQGRLRDCLEEQEARISQATDRRLAGTTADLAEVQKVTDELRALQAAAGQDLAACQEGLQRLQGDVDVLKSEGEETRLRQQSDLAACREAAQQGVAVSRALEETLLQQEPTVACLRQDVLELQAGQQAACQGVDTLRSLMEEAADERRTCDEDLRGLRKLTEELFCGLETHQHVLTTNVQAKHEDFARMLGQQAQDVEAKHEHFAGMLGQQAQDIKAKHEDFARMLGQQAQDIKAKHEDFARMLGQQAQDVEAKHEHFAGMLGQQAQDIKVKHEDFARVMGQQAQDIKAVSERREAQQRHWAAGLEEQVGDAVAAKLHSSGWRQDVVEQLQRQFEETLRLREHWHLEQTKLAERCDSAGVDLRELRVLLDDELRERSRLREDVAALQCSLLYGMEDPSQVSLRASRRPHDDAKMVKWADDLWHEEQHAAAVVLEPVARRLQEAAPSNEAASTDMAGSE
eukprot:TRINITY_DN4640_c0_g1_i3.p1 TRINITY_DN4640_c0_g1~~TRINITY_DN4640_c0_g1_i3.p1  ORF type:complete len:745 (-),score=312.94 TRINITY_DN4640_c0_g1_i3:54-2288(-)